MEHAHVPGCSALRSNATWHGQMGIVVARLTSTACALALAGAQEQEAQAQRSVLISQASIQRQERMQQLRTAQADATRFNGVNRPHIVVHGVDSMHRPQIQFEPKRTLLQARLRFK